MDFLDKLQSRKLIQLWVTLSEQELSLFSGFVRSGSVPLSNADLELFEMLQSAFPFQTIEQVRNLERWLLDQKKYSTGVINKSFWSLNQVLEQCLVFAELKQEEVSYQKLLRQVYRKRSLHNSFFKKLQLELEQIELDEQRDPSYYFRKYDLFAELFYHPDTPKYQQEVESLAAMERYLDRFYVASKLRLLCQQYSRKNMLNDNSALFFEKPILEYAKANQEILFFKLYLNLIDLYKNFEERKLKELVSQLMSEDWRILSKREAAVVCLLVLNFIIRLANEGQQEYLLIYFDLFKWASNQDLLVFDDRITYMTYQNLITTACVLGKFSYAQQFIRKFSRYLKPELREDAKELALGRVYFMQKNYQKAHEKLASVNFKILEFKLLGKALLVRCYYELFRQKKQAIDNLHLSHLSNFSRFIKSNRNLSDSKKLLYLNFISKIRILSRYRDKANSVRFRKRKELEAELLPDDYPVIVKKWLLEKVRQL